MGETVEGDEVHGSLHLNFDAHPRVDAALEQMLPLGQTGDIEMAALNDSLLKHVDPLQVTTR